MNQSLIAFAVIISSFSCSDRREDSSNKDWVTIESENDSYKISLPFDTYKSHDEEYYVESVGKVFSHEIDLNTQQLNDKNEGYKFTVYDYPEFNFYESPDIIPKFLRETLDNLVLGLGATKIREKKIEYNGYPGRELYYYNKSLGAYFTTRVYIIEGKQYHFTVITDKENLANKSITKFFESFILN